MKLEKILDQLNSFEKNAFLKIVDNIITSSPKNALEIEKILSDKSKDLKTVDNLNISKVFNLVDQEFAQHVEDQLNDTDSQLDVLGALLIRDGSCIMKLDWLSRLYERELLEIESKLKAFNSSISVDSDEIEYSRKRDYLIYRHCLNTAYFNDLENNQEPKITGDELSILTTLGKQLGLSQEEIKLINHSVIPLKRLEVDALIDGLKTLGIIFYSKKNNTIYVADEIVVILRKIRGKEIADKFYRRVLRLLRESQINSICKKHNIDWRDPFELKIKNIIKEGISFTTALIEDIHKDDTKVSDRKKFLNDFCDHDLKISPSVRGATIDEKVQNLIQHFSQIEKDERVGISVEGYDKLLRDLAASVPTAVDSIRHEFELQDEKGIDCNSLLDYNIKPRDVLEIITAKELEAFCIARGISMRGDDVSNILEAYKDAENLYLENYESIGYRNFIDLKEKGIVIKEIEIGDKFEELTKVIFKALGLNVDEQLRKQLSTRNDKIDIVINLGNNELIIVECKTIKESGYNKFSSVSRQLKSYTELGKSAGYSVTKVLLIAPEFSDDFVNECGLDYELNLSLITAGSMLRILHGFKDSKLKLFPYKLLFRDVLIHEDRILKAIEK